jgi:cytochrome c-type biogenesis protein CcmF
MIDLGHFSLVCAFILSVLGLLLGVHGAWRKDRRSAIAARNASYLVALLSILSLLSLMILFLKHDYRYAYVWKTSNNDMDTLYLITAVWGGMDGSMLLWAALTALYAASALFFSNTLSATIMNWVTPVFHLAAGFFLLVVTFFTNPFRFNPGGVIPADGNGLNPLLQNPSMVIHPPSLYLGFTGFVVPFGFAIGTLLSGEFNFRWTEAIRRWTLIAWGFLTCGIILGGHWAYVELGWGGFWAWDPVENASFLPWLAATAYLHSAKVEERRGMLKLWNFILSILSYTLAVFGTFLTRSGIVQSVHAFAESDIGHVFLIYLGIIIFCSAVLLIWRNKELTAERKFESYVSREMAFLLNNLVLLGICFATFWGVMFPVFSEFFTGTKAVVGPPFFNAVNGPLFLVLLFLMGAGPLLAWKKSSTRLLTKSFLYPAVVSSAVYILCLYLDVSKPLAGLSFALSIFVLMSVFSELHRAVKVNKVRSDRYGGLIVHLGIAVIAFSATASTVYKIEKDIALKVGDIATVGRYNLKLAKVEEKPNPNYVALVATVDVLDQYSSTLIDTLHPEKRIYQNRNADVTTEVAMRVTPLEDLYLALGGIDRETDASGKEQLSLAFKVFVNPLQVWLWLGGIVTLIGTLMTLCRSQNFLS